MAVGSVLHVTPDDIHRKNALAERAAKGFNITLRAYPPTHYYDFDVFRHRRHLGYLQTKCRHDITFSSLERLKGIYFDEERWLEWKQLTVDTGLPFRIVVSDMTNAALWIRLQDNEFDGFPVDPNGGRTDRNDPRDLKPCVMVLPSLMEELK